jgi:hypothetical protein
MSIYRLNDHIRCRLQTPDGPKTITGEIIKIFPGGSSYWLHVRQADGSVRMLFEATAEIQVLDATPA